MYSPFSNIVSIGVEAFYKEASDWKKSELQKANDLGLIPAILKGDDMTKPITREEFTELAVVLYERVTNKKSEPVFPNPFTDTAIMIGYTSEQTLVALYYLYVDFMKGLEDFFTYKQDD